MYESSKKQATITTRTVGENFGTSGVVRVGGRKVFQGPTRPFGFTDAAVRDAEQWAEEHGYAVRPHVNDAQGWSDYANDNGHT